MNYRLTMASQGTQLTGLREDQAVNENSADRLTAVREEIDDLKGKAEEAVQRTEDAEEDATQAKQDRSEEHTSELQSRGHLVCRLLLEKKKWKEQHQELH